jgi:hypothetical protein
MITREELQEGMQRIIEKSGSRLGFMFDQLCNLATSGQSCDVCFYSRKPCINVRIKPTFLHALMYGAGPEKLGEMLDNIKLEGGDEADLVKKIN